MYVVNNNFYQCEEEVGKSFRIFPDEDVNVDEDFIFCRKRVVCPKNDCKKKVEKFFVQVGSSDICVYDVKPSIKKTKSFEDARVIVFQVFVGSRQAYYLVYFKKTKMLGTVEMRYTLNVPHPDILQFTWVNMLDEAPTSQALIFANDVCYEYDGYALQSDIKTFCVTGNTLVVDEKTSYKVEARRNLV